jgi:hypothetical protein
MPGWFHTEKEKFISSDFSFCSRDFDPSPNLSPTRGEALKHIGLFFSDCMKPPCIALVRWGEQGRKNLISFYTFTHGII